ncbi:MarC family protein [Candidatus Pacearchaeota archaeon]|nr:MarC family protein [Candidatus Pacearchaeota archaeon]
MDYTALFKAIVMLFIISDSLGNLPLFITLTLKKTQEERKKIFRQAILTAFTILFVFALIGYLVLSFFDIKLGSFAIAGGLLLLLLGISISLGKEKELITSKSMAYVPMATPLIAGPGAITAVLLTIQTSSWLIAVLSIIIVFIITKLIFWKAESLHKLLGKNGSILISRLSGIIVSAIGIEFIINGLKMTGVIA